MKDKIETFIENGLFKESPKKMRSQIIAVNFFPIIGIMYGLILGGLYFAISCAIAISATIEYIYIVIITRREDKKSIIKAQACVSTSVCINYLLFAILLYSMHSGFNLGVCTLFIPPICIIVLTFLFLYKFFKKDSIQKKAILHKGGILSGSVAIFTYISLKIWNVSIDHDLALILGIIGLVIISSLGALGIVDYIKIYFMNKIEKIL